MQEIFFRGISIKENIWVYGNFVKNSDGNSFINDGKKNIAVKPETVGQKWTVNEELSFFTGDLFALLSGPMIDFFSEKNIQDKTPKEIITGTNFSFKETPYVGVVTFTGYGIWIDIWRNGKWEKARCINYSQLTQIGNIFENSDMLIEY
jgi:hypothetical protein